MPSRTSTQLLAHRVRGRRIGRSARSDDGINRMVGTSTRPVGGTRWFGRVLDNPKHTSILDRHLTRLEVFGRTLSQMVRPIRRTRLFFISILQFEWSLGRPVTNDHLDRTSTHWGRGDLETSGNILGKLWALDHFSPNVSTNHILGTFRL